MKIQIFVDLLSPIVSWFRSKPVMTPPSTGNTLSNIFGPVETERVQQVYESSTGCFSCNSSTTTVAFTDSRVIVRYQDPNTCCCCTGPHTDFSTYLSEVHGFRNTTQLIGDCNDFLSCNIVGGLLAKICPCCGERAVRIHISGGFGTQTLFFKLLELPNAVSSLLHLTNSAHKWKQDRKSVV